MLAFPKMEKHLFGKWFIQKKLWQNFHGLKSILYFDQISTGEIFGKVSWTIEETEKKTSSNLNKIVHGKVSLYLGKGLALYLIDSNKVGYFPIKKYISLIQNAQIKKISTMAKITIFGTGIKNSLTFYDLE